MKAPKRTPWSSRSELEELYEMLFAPNADDTSRRRGLARMSIYISSPSCPTFIHLLHSLVSVELLPYPPKSIEENQRSRMMIGMAIVRFINGLVDPLQNGPYARPISHLAATLSISPSLISLRHRATHEDLPPLALLHQSLLSCISYLHYYSFLPLLSSSSASAGMNIPAGMVEKMHADKKKIEGLLKRWKKVMKTRLREREVREEDQSAVELRKIKKLLQAFEGSLIIDCLLAKGGIVPLAIEKRANKSSHSPTTPSLKIWLPLLEHLQETSHPDLSTVMTSKILDLLLNPISTSSSQQEPPYLNIDMAGPESASGSGSGNGQAKEDVLTYRWDLASWLSYIWNIQDDSPSTFTLSGDAKDEMIRRILAALLELHNDAVVRRLFRALQSHTPSSQNALQDIDRFLPDVISPDGREDGDEAGDELKGLEVDMDENENGLSDEMEKDLQKMEERFKSFNEMYPQRKTLTTVHGIVNNNLSLQLKSDTLNDAAAADDIPSGWRRLTSESWKPCYIGSNGLI
ncbi:uncharacterized protein I303_101120 [Kwoniella dejecticola CBS 10117]|uniref:Las1-domain-containing protein n=1 Tax=Kwoniella dejecticola CBS 10117 TaxID=1296121 RepID=A0A1A6AGV7_9TREE|nr:uncharacterized protein I303_01124 [Kwoniella dejecticola CBS 10117]OBR89299.1 hypothetical protein I303_01124 [Kwoniella dejecticola CBS 10117]